MTKEDSSSSVLEKNLVVGFACYAQGVGFHAETSDVKKLLRVYQELKEGFRNEPGYAPLSTGNSYGRR